MAELGNEEKKTAPPYIPAATFWGFLAGLKMAVPPRIDRSLMKSMAGSSQLQLMHALRFLDLIDDEGIVSEELRFLIQAEGEDRRESVAKLLESKYAFIREGGGFDLSNATAKQLDDEFRKLGAEGDTSKKCQRFFLALATEVGYVVSPHIKSPGRVPARSSVNRPKTSKSRKGSKQEQGNTPPIPVTPKKAEGDFWSEALQKLPSFDPSMGKEGVENYLKAMGLILEAKAKADGIESSSELPNGNGEKKEV